MNRDRKKLVRIGLNGGRRLVSVQRREKNSEQETTHIWGGKRSHVLKAVGKKKEVVWGKKSNKFHKKGGLT